jgi:hypothetical protein
MAWKIMLLSFSTNISPLQGFENYVHLFSTKMSPLQGLKKCDRLFIAYLMLPLHGLENYASLLFYQYIALTGL